MACRAGEMRVGAEEFVAARQKVVKPGLRYNGSDLEGATFDAGYGLEEAGFRVGRTKRTGELAQMVLYECRADWPSVTPDEVVRRLEQAWVDRGAFRHKAHALAAGEDVVALDFVTWWDSGKLYTGQTEVRLR